MKKSKTIFLLTTLLLTGPLVFAQISALDEINKKRSDANHLAEKNSESLKLLNDEKKLLIDKLVDINKQYDGIMKVQAQKQEFPPEVISLQEIEKFLRNKTMDRCKITAGEYPGEYIIQKDKVKIRFAFLPKDSLFSPKLSIVKGDQNEDVFQIEQPGYDANAVQNKGYIHAIIRFSIKPESNSPGEITHASFSGQRLNDKWFGQSSLDLTPVTCVLGK